MVGCGVRSRAADPRGCLRELYGQACHACQTENRIIQSVYQTVVQDLRVAHCLMSRANDVARDIAGAKVINPLPRGPGLQGFRDKIE